MRSRLARRYLDGCGYGSGREFTERLARSAVSGDVLLDVGCGEARLRELVAPGVLYVGLDRYAGAQQNEYSSWNMRPSVLGDAHQLPIATGVCRTVVLLHVLEHVRVPTQVFDEVCRVLQPGGNLFVDVPFMHQIHHAPHDYYRYTPYGLMALAENAGLEVVEIRPSGGYFRSLSHLLEEAPIVVGRSSRFGALARLAVAYPLKALGWGIGKLEYLLDMFDSSQVFTCGYHCIFRKPTNASG
jgi:SAM-dependent methyltransferase